MWVRERMKSLIIFCVRRKGPGLRGQQGNRVCRPYWVWNVSPVPSRPESKLQALQRHPMCHTNQSVCSSSPPSQVTPVKGAHVQQRTVLWPTGSFYPIQHGEKWVELALRQSSSKHPSQLPQTTTSTNKLIKTTIQLIKTTIQLTLLFSLFFWEWQTIIYGHSQTIYLDCWSWTDLFSKNIRG